MELLLLLFNEYNDSFKAKYYIITVLWNFIRMELFEITKISIARGHYRINKKSNEQKNLKKLIKK